MGGQKIVIYSEEEIPDIRPEDVNRLVDGEYSHLDFITKNPILRHSMAE
jgi:hypothetical protein